MKAIFVSALLVTSLLGSFYSAQAFNNQWQEEQQSLLRPYQQNTYGPGVNSDATGRPFKYQTRDGQDLQPNSRIEPDGYGYGVDMDEYGRPVKAKPW